MDERPGVSETHNLVITNYLTNHQIKSMCFFKLDTHRTVYRSKKEHRYFTCVVLASRCLLKMVAIFQDGHHEQLGQWKIFEDILRVHSWDKLLVVQTAQKIVGLSFDNRMLKNSFMLSLQFLHLNRRDQCTILTDRSGCYLVVKVAGYLLICVSDMAVQKHRSKPYQKPGAEIVRQDVKWNGQTRSYISEIIKIKLSDLNFLRIDDLRICDECLYFMGTKFKQVGLYFMPLSLFYLENDPRPICKLITLRGNDVARIIPIHINKEIEYLFVKNADIKEMSLQTQRGLLLVQTFEKDYEIIYETIHSVFPLCVREKGSLAVKIIERERNYTNSYDFKVRVVTMGNYVDRLLFKDNLIVSCAASGVMVMPVESNNAVRVHRSFGSIIDFNLGKNMLIIDNYEGNLTRVYELTRGLNINPKPYVTHSKKMLLEGITDLVTIESIALEERETHKEGGQENSGLQKVVQSENISQIGELKLSEEEALKQTVEKQIEKTKIDVLFMSRNIQGTMRFSIYKQHQQTFQLLFQDLLHCQSTTVNGISYLLLCYPEYLLLTNTLSFSLQTAYPYGQLSKQNKRWLINEHFIVKKGLTLTIINLLNSKSVRIGTVERMSSSLVACLLTQKELTMRKKDKDVLQFEYMLVYEDCLDIYEIILREGETQIRKVFSGEGIGEGPAMLFSSEEDQEERDVDKEKYRSITCPEYVLSNHSMSELRSRTYIKAANVYNNGVSCYLLFVTTEEEIVLYKQYLSFTDDKGYAYRRVIVPLNVVKVFRWNADTFGQLGVGINRVCNVLFVDGNFLDHNGSVKSIFRFDGSDWVLLSDNKIRQLDLRGQIFANFIVTPIPLSIKHEMMGIESSTSYFCIYSRHAFQIISAKDYSVFWQPSLISEMTDHPETIICLKMFEHYVAMSYYDYLDSESGECQAVKFKFRIYNILTKQKIVEKEKTMDEPIVSIKFVQPDKIILSTSSTIFVNVLRNDKTLELIRTSNFASKRTFLTSLSYLPEILPTKDIAAKQGYMLFGGSHGGLSFFVGKWIEEDKLKEQWFQGFKCSMREVQFFEYGDELNAILSDEDKNIVVINLKKGSAERVADYHLGALVNAFKIRTENDRMVYCCLNDGSIKIVNSVQLQKTEISLLDLQQLFCQQLPFLGGFNLRRSRELNQQYRSYKFVAKGNMLDGEILEQFYALSCTLRLHIMDLSELSWAQLKAVLI